MTESFMTITKLIFEENQKAIKETIANSLYLSIPSEFLSFSIAIDLISLCEAHPKQIQEIIQDYIGFKNLLRELIKMEIMEVYTKEKIEHVQMIIFKDLFDVTIDLFNTPILALHTDIRDVLSIIQPKYNIIAKNPDLVSAEQTYEVISKVSVSINTLRGKISTIGEKTEQTSSFFSCMNRSCSDKTYLFKLKSISYAFMDTKRTFTFKTNVSTSTCFKCKTNLVEIIKKRRFKKLYTFMITDTEFNLRGESEVNLVSEEECVTKDVFLVGHLIRTNKGTPLFSLISAGFIEDIENGGKKIARVELNSRGKLEDDLLKITSLYFSSFKELCTIEDTLLFIILNIINQSNTKVLLFTSDPVYASRCSQNILRNQGLYRKICYDHKRFKEPSGICIRAYDEGLIKKIAVDHVFNLSICNFLDYKYNPPPNEDIEININPSYKTLFNNTMYSSQVEILPFSSIYSDYTPIQHLFLTFRESYKGVIEPERLFNTLLSLYKSIEEIMQGEKEEQYADFILRHFKDKLI
ncbi:hypothetical protein NGRA_1469 [Nosema granulosis]|uniref:Uncharacterized protein n=1 Tax=Nosema granulosis TaxID=83296 RepID=A0A9P6GYF1_9MICR|nr:hypothetical protein NGRA_1469 [Nosema granulosis]